MTLSAYDREWLKRLLAYINETRGIDFSMYRHATVQRKLELRIEATKTGHYRHYLEHIKSRPEELDSLITALTIKVSTFFRNPLVFELLGAFVLPELAAEFGFLKVWSLGCAHGQEPYSVAMLALDLMKREKPVDIKILGTDVCDGAIGRSFEGTYPESELSDVKKKFLESFFERIAPGPDQRHAQEGMFRVSNEIKSIVRLECGDMLSRLKQSRAKEDRYNLILCRNVLIYMNRFLQSEVVRLISDILHENGYLVIGESEMLHEASREFFTQPFPGIKIFRKKSPLKKEGQGPS